MSATQRQDTESPAAGNAPIASQQPITQEAEPPSKEPLPPHIIVTCAGDRAAFGRFALLQMDYETALDVFFDEFLEPTDSAKSDARILATFWHKHGGNDKHPVRLHPSSWRELIPNVTEIKLIVDVTDSDSEAFDVDELE